MASLALREVAVLASLDREDWEALDVGATDCDPLGSWELDQVADLASVYLEELDRLPKEASA